jgi:hypothetical protein
MRCTGRLTSLAASALLALAAGCAADSGGTGASGNQTIDHDDLVKPEEGKADSSALAAFVVMEFDGKVMLDSTWNVKSSIEDQLLYTIGHLNADNSVGRLDHVQLSDIQQSSQNGKTLVTYHAKLPVAWGNKDNVPKNYTFKLPLDGSYSGYESFTTKYKDSCVDWSAHEVDSGSMWYYYRPFTSGCNLAETDVFTAQAKVTPSANATSGKYPEYDKVWEDNSLRVVAVFGKYEEGATTASDAGISAFNEFYSEVTSRFASNNLTTIPENVPRDPGVKAPDIEYHATLADGRTVVINALLVDKLYSAGPDFDARYEPLSTTADFIVYNGHAGLGANIRALAQKGKWKQGQYAIVFENGCDSYAYVDSAMWDAHAAVNPDDPKGTKYLDVLINAMPAYFASDAGATMAVVNGLLSYNDPKTYDQIFKDVDSSQVVMVTGEEDNTFVPGGVDNNPPDNGWNGLHESGSVSRDQETRFETPKLAAGTYQFDMSGTGDADLYVRVGMAPTSKSYDCRPYKAGSKESCTVEINTDAPLHVMVRGYAASSTFDLTGTRK